MRYLLLLLLAGCATMGGMRAGNRERLGHISLGMTKEEVLSVMGTGTKHVQGDRITNPYRTEAYRAAGSEWEVLLYYTDIKREDGAITDDELTPIVLKDGRVDGWGWMYWQDAVRKYEIRVR